MNGYLGVKNITNVIDKVWGPMPGREWYIGLRSNFNIDKQ
jgi:hypothetical protein